jgi:hypothetical protein
MIVNVDSQREVFATVAEAVVVVVSMLVFHFEELVETVDQSIVGQKHY